MRGDRFSDEWMEKVEDWAYKNEAMIKRYEARKTYREMQDSVEYLHLSPFEMYKF